MSIEPLLQQLENIVQQYARLDARDAVDLILDQIRTNVEEQSSEAFIEGFRYARDIANNAIIELYRDNPIPNNEALFVRDQIAAKLTILETK